MFTMGLPLGVCAEERVTITGDILDGSPSEPSPKMELPAVVIRESRTNNLSDRKITFNRVADPKLPVPRPSLPEKAPLSAKQIEGIQNSPEVQRWIKEAKQTTHLFLSATVVDEKATLLRWWHEGVEFQAWSNVNFNYLTGFAEYRKGEQLYSALLMVGDVSSAQQPEDSPYRIPAGLPSGKPALIPVGEFEEMAENVKTLDAIHALHELYQTEGERLKWAHVQRKLKRKEREAALLTNPPVPEDVVLNYWKIETKADKVVEVEGGAQ